MAGPEAELRGSQCVFDGANEGEVPLAAELAPEVIQVQRPYGGAPQLLNFQVLHLGVGGRIGFLATSPSNHLPSQATCELCALPTTLSFPTGHRPSFSLSPGLGMSYLLLDAFLVIVAHPLVALGGIGHLLVNSVDSGSSEKATDLGRETQCLDE